MRASARLLVCRELCFSCLWATSLSAPPPLAAGLARCCPPTHSEEPPVPQMRQSFIVLYIYKFRLTELTCVCMVKRTQCERGSRRRVCRSERYFTSSGGSCIQGQARTRLTRWTKYSRRKARSAISFVRSPRRVSTNQVRVSFTCTYGPWKRLDICGWC